METTWEVSGRDLGKLCGNEWLVTNGLGGYASSTIASLNTRKYHGLLVAAMTPPARRMVILSRIEETLCFGGRRFELACNEYPQTIYPQGHKYLRAFNSEPFPRWGYQADGWTIEKQLRLLPGRNAVVLSYTMWGGKQPGALELRPLLALRPIHELMYQWNGPLGVDRQEIGQYHVAATSKTPEVFFTHAGSWQSEPSWYLNTIYRREQQRGYAGLEDLWCPGVAHLRLVPGLSAHFVCCTEPISIEEALAELEPRQAEAAPSMSPIELTTAKDRQQPAQRGPAAMDADMALLCRAAEAFLPAASFPPQRVPCLGDYHWSAPSPRSALLGFTGLYLVTGRFEQGRALLLALAGLLQDGLIPAMLPEDASPPQYRGADVSLWFVNAVWNYFRYTGDRATVQHALLGPVLSIIEHYSHGTLLGIAAREDGILVSRSPGIPTTWMDAKLGDWLVTPRAGAAVELNALWYNALRIAAALTEIPGVARPPEPMSSMAGKCFEAFNRRFWNASLGCCFDVIDENSTDSAVRPNQLLAMSLPFSVLRADRYAAVLGRVQGDLLTPMGLRTLGDRDPAYQGRCQGNLVSRDRAVHNGSVFPWLLGPYVTAFVRLHGRNAEMLQQARDVLRPCIDRIRGEGLGHLRELFDGDAPHAPGGAIASAAGVAELLRCYSEDILDQQPVGQPPATRNPLEQLEQSA